MHSSYRRKFEATLIDRTINIKWIVFFFNEKMTILDAKLKFQDFYFIVHICMRICVPECWSHGGLEREQDLPELEPPNAGAGN